MPLSPTNKKIVLSSVQAGGSAAAMLAPASLAGPIGLAVAGAVVGLMALFSRKRGKQKIAATEIVDKLEPLLKDNRDGYLNGPRTPASQEVALANFDAALAWLESPEACGNAELGDAGRRCISERVRGGRWQWPARYRDPIANDTPVAAAPAAEIKQQLGHDFEQLAAQTGLPPAALIGGGLLLMGALL